MSDAELDHLLTRVIEEMRLDRESEHEVLDELRGHLEQAVADELACGLTRADAIHKAAARFGLGDDVGKELQDTHVGWGTADAVMAAALPVLCGLVLRWLVYAPDGTALGWPRLIEQPAFWIVALAALAIPLIRFPRWRYALVSWGIFWIITVIFVAGSTARW